MTYDLSFDNDSDIVKAGANKIVYLTITYQNEVPEDKLVNTYQESKEFNLELLNEDGTAAKIENPKTGITSVIPMFVVMISGVVAFVVLRKYRKSKMLVLILLVSVLPLATYALETLTIDINSKVVISAKELCIEYRLPTPTDVGYEKIRHYFRYKNGMTWNEFIYSNYNKLTDETIVRIETSSENKEYTFKEIKENSPSGMVFPDYLFGYFDEDNSIEYPGSYEEHVPDMFIINSNNSHSYFSSLKDLFESKIQDSSKGCYSWRELKDEGSDFSNAYEKYEPSKSSRAQQK